MRLTDLPAGSWSGSGHLNRGHEAVDASPHPNGSVKAPIRGVGRFKSQKAAFPLGEEVRISRLGLKPAPRSEKADIGSTEK